MLITKFNALIRNKVLPEDRTLRPGLQQIINEHDPEQKRSPHHRNRTGGNAQRSHCSRDLPNILDDTLAPI